MDLQLVRWHIELSTKEAIQGAIQQVGSMVCCFEMPTKEATQGAVQQVTAMRFAIQGVDQQAIQVCVDLHVEMHPVCNTMPIEQCVDLHAANRVRINAWINRQIKCRRMDAA